MQVLLQVILSTALKESLSSDCN